MVSWVGGGGDYLADRSISLYAIYFLRNSQSPHKLKLSGLNNKKLLLFLLKCMLNERNFNNL